MGIGPRSTGFEALVDLSNPSVSTLKARLRSITTPTQRLLYLDRLHKLKPSGLDAFLRADCHLLSYPKSGRTWLRAMLGTALERHLSLSNWDPIELESLTPTPGHPRIRVSHDGSPHLTTSAWVERLKLRYFRRKVILLVRDPRDVVVSMYFQRVHREKIFQGGMTAFIRQPVGGIDCIVQYLNAWERCRSIPSELLIMKYSELMRTPAEGLTQALNFLGYFPDPCVVQQAVEVCAFDQMKRLESEGKLGGYRFSSGQDEAAHKVRRGVVGGYRDYVEAADLRYLEERMKRLHPFWNYTRWLEHDC